MDWKKLKQQLLGYVYPQKCIICGALVSVDREIEICDTCLYEKNLMPEIAEKPLSNFYPATYCAGIFCLYPYAGWVRESLLQFKFYEREAYYRVFAKLLALHLSQYHQREPFDGVLAVPLHRKRLRERGFNQSELISEVVAETLGIAHVSDAIQRVRYTRPQSLLSKEERQENIKNAFKIEKTHKIALKKLLIIDDILTTGSTLEECSKVLMEGNAKNVLAAVLASGRK